jgi:hypothetical protein
MHLLSERCEHWHRVHSTISRHKQQSSCDRTTIDDTWVYGSNLGFVTSGIAWVHTVTRFHWDSLELRHFCTSCRQWGEFWIQFAVLRAHWSTCSPRTCGYFIMMTSSCNYSFWKWRTTSKLSLHWLPLVTIGITSQFPCEHVCEATWFLFTEPSAFDYLKVSNGTESRTNMVVWPVIRFVTWRARWVPVCFVMWLPRPD